MDSLHTYLHRSYDKMSPEFFYPFIIFSDVELYSIERNYEKSGTHHRKSELELYLSPNFMVGVKFLTRFGPVFGRFVFKRYACGRATMTLAALTLWTATPILWGKYAPALSCAVTFRN